MSSSKRCILVAVGGPSCSGKTTLSKHLARIIPNCQILHQDDFAPPADKLPIHPILNVADWDHPDGAIEWPRMRSTLKELKESGQFPDNHKSHDYLNEQIPVPISEDVVSHWKNVFSSSLANDTSIVIADGFLLYYDSICNSFWDLRIFVREDEEVLKKRRDDRNGYYTAVLGDCLEGEYWKDPPEYWSEIVWPAYLLAHQHMFVGGDVENGQLKEDQEVLLLKGEFGGIGMAKMVERSCEEILRLIKTTAA
ncbi:P-loop containing nucleoside triphosphate hydrolase protein [Atractiella rhizophila]|nr:P-loop containing nucleoside triphosphate hydrolase protein [Atractiella rhizophila]